MLNFRRAVSGEKEFLEEITKNTVRGVVAYSFLMSAGGGFYDNFLCGEEENEIKSVIFDTGDEYFLIFGEEFPLLFEKCTKTIMVYKKGEMRNTGAQRLEGKEIQEMYKLISEKKQLSFDDERRYVLRLRAKNAGLCEVFGIKKDGILVSCAAVSSLNEKFGLIADVFTKKEERGKGYALICLSEAVNFILGKGKIPMLLCDENMCAYYEKAGFEIYGKM